VNSSSLTLVLCNFERNYAADTGGGLLAVFSSLSFQDSYWRSNNASVAVRP
jgi:hypothetical protein